MNKTTFKLNVKVNFIRENDETGFEFSKIMLLPSHPWEETKLKILDGFNVDLPSEKQKYHLNTSDADWNFYALDNSIHINFRDIVQDLKIQSVVCENSIDMKYEKFREEILKRNFTVKTFCL